MRRVGILAMATVLALPIAAHAAAIDVPLKYQRTTDEGRQFQPSGFLWVESKLEAPAGNWKLPTFVGAQPVYGLVRWGDREHLAILDRKNASDPFYSRLYFDANANRDLTDDRVIDGVAQSSDGDFRAVDFKTIDTEIVLDGKTLPYAFKPYAYYSGPQPMNLKAGPGRANLSFYFQIPCAYTGEVDLGGHLYQFAVSDNNGNGRFNDTFTVPKDVRSDGPVYAQGDSFYVVSRKSLDYYDGQPLGKRLFLAGKLYDVAISTTEGKMTLTPVEGNLSTLAVPDEIQRLEMYTDAGDSIMAYMPGQLGLPAGQYRLASYQVVRNDGKGQWRLSASATSNTPPVEVKADASTKLGVGEPFQPIVKASDGAQVRLSFTVNGIAKEQVTDIRLVSGTSAIETSRKDHARPKEPTYRILKDDGEVVTQGSFEYG